MKNKVVFFQIKTPIDKLVKITKMASVHFSNKKKLLFLTSDEKAQKYLDNLLWKDPCFSFLPHVLSDEKTDDFIVITKQKTLNINNSDYIFNLTPEPVSSLQCSVIYEFEDLPGSQKQLISKQKFKFYKQNNFLVQND